MENINIENIAYCGLYCADCPNRKGIIADLARDLRKELRTYRFDKTAELLSSYSFFKTLKKKGIEEFIKGKKHWYALK
ncbi:MAG: hypothetical protein K8R54_15495 [Bacteroidales bacterium]|nr:hypothetical protein [Bacteroidales bacterium]